MRKKGIFLLLFGVFFMAFSEASANDKYLIDIDVDVTAQDAAKAREQAMSDANRSAFVKVVMQSTSAPYIEKFASFTDEQILNFIKEVEVSEEKSSAFRYAAKLKVLVDGDLLEEYMKENAIPSGNVPEFIIIPTFQKNKKSRLLLTEDENVWRKAWKAKGLILQDFGVFSAADDKFLSQIRDEELVEPKASAAYAIMAANPSANVYLAKMMPDDSNHLVVQVINMKNGNDGYFSIYGEPNEQNLSIAADMLVSYIKKDLSETGVKKQPQEIKQAERQINILYDYKNLTDLVETEKKLSKISGIQKINLATMGIKKARFVATVSFLYDEQFAYTLSENGYALKQYGNAYLVEKKEK